MTDSFHILVCRCLTVFTHPPFALLVTDISTEYLSAASHSPPWRLRLQQPLVLPPRSVLISLAAWYAYQAPCNAHLATARYHVCGLCCSVRVPESRSKAPREEPFPGDNSTTSRATAMSSCCKLRIFHFLY